MIKVFYVLGLLALVLGCKPKTEFDKVKERELASGKVVEDLFLDLHFGMGRKDFFGTCWEWNKKGVLTNGAHQLMVLYKPEMPSGKETNMHFYPAFEDNKLFFMPMEFNYPAWFPGNEEYTVEKLMDDVVGLLEGWYGEGFFEVTNKNKTARAIVRVDGNRLIRVFRKDITNVRVEMLDLRVKDLPDMINKDDDA
ncbi:MAG: hypothetical protein EA341_16470 [Mongoliibacter sp.]|nr:MAG: hypothetical protein EA341_16470 [Mongoliibacter sp.]